MGLSSDFARAYAWIVPSVMQAMGAVTLRIIEPAPRLAMLAGCRWLAGEQVGRPGAVVRLQSQFVVRVVSGQLLQLASVLSTTRHGFPRISTDSINNQKSTISNCEMTASDRKGYTRGD